MKPISDEERVETILNAAFPDGRNKNRRRKTQVMTHDAYIDLRKHLNLLMPNDVQHYLPGVLIDALNYHDPTPYEYLDFIIFFLDVHGTNWSKEDPNFKAAIRRFCESEAPSDLRRDLERLLHNPLIFQVASTRTEGLRQHDYECASREESFSMITVLQSDAIVHWLKLASSWKAFDSRGAQRDIISALIYWNMRAYASGPGTILADAKTPRTGEAKKKRRLR